MNIIELTEDDVPRQVKVGDVVLVSATVQEVRPAIGVRVELFTRNDQLDLWLMPNTVVGLIDPEVPTEPGNDTWLVGANDDTLSGGINVFHRDDEHAPTERGRRWPRCWQVAGSGEWVDWPTAYHRGADPARELHHHQGTTE